jgi:hypothetical protein
VVCSRHTYVAIQGVLVPRSIPKRALERVHLGQSFAEYDDHLTNPAVYVSNSSAVGSDYVE